MVWRQFTKAFFLFLFTEFELLTLQKYSAFYEGFLLVFDFFFFLSGFWCLSFETCMIRPSLSLRLLGFLARRAGKHTNLGKSS